MATFTYTEKKKTTIENGRFVRKKHEAIKFNGRTFSIGEIIGFQYGDTTIVGKLEIIDKIDKIIYVSLRGDKENIYGFYLDLINEVYGN